jgi:hypothetical protein
MKLMETMMAKDKVTKTSVTLGVMAANADKPMAEVVALILKAQHKAGFTDVTLKICEGAYRWAVKSGKADGKVETKAKTAKAKIEPKTAKIKSVIAEDNKRIKAEPKKVEAKPKGNRFTGKLKTEKSVATAAPKTDDDIAKIKAANLKRMKEITERNKVIRAQYNGNIARGADAPFDPLDFTPEGARAEVDQMYKDLDSFEMPKFLSKDQVKALV